MVNVFLNPSFDILEKTIGVASRACAVKSVDLLFVLGPASYLRELLSGDFVNLELWKKEFLFEDKLVQYRSSETGKEPGRCHFTSSLLVLSMLPTLHWNKEVARLRSRVCSALDPSPATMV